MNIRFNVDIVKENNKRRYLIISSEDKYILYDPMIASLLDWSLEDYIVGAGFSLHTMSVVGWNNMINTAKNSIVSVRNLDIEELRVFIKFSI